LGITRTRFLSFKFLVSSQFHIYNDDVMLSCEHSSVSWKVHCNMLIDGVNRVHT
jgi:hypothetical protein